MVSVECFKVNLMVLWYVIREECESGLVLSLSL